MTDRDVRALARRFRETGALEDHARWLAARVRGGELGEHRVRFAAELGHAAAGRALGVAPAPLGRVLSEGLREAAAISRQASATADAHWVLTGRSLDLAPSLEPELDEGHLRARSLEAIQALVAPRIEEARRPDDAAEGGDEPYLTRAAVLACFSSPEHDRIGRLLDEVEALREEQVGELDDAGLDDEPGWPGLQLLWELRLPAAFSPAARLAHELASTPRGLAHLMAVAAPWDGAHRAGGGRGRGRGRGAARDPRGGRPRPPA